MKQVLAEECEIRFVLFYSTARTEILLSRPLAISNLRIGEK